MESKLKLGQTVTDKITGLTGVITCIAEFMHSPPRVCVTPRKKPKDAEKESDHWLDEARLKPGKIALKVERKPATVPFGQKVKDPISGFSGVATARFFHINGCIQIEVTPDKLKADGSIIKPWAFDEQRLEWKGKTESKAGPGGPSIECPGLPTC